MVSTTEMVPLKTDINLPILETYLSTILDF